MFLNEVTNMEKCTFCEMEIMKCNYFPKKEKDVYHTKYCKGYLHINGLHYCSNGMGIARP